MAAFFFQTQGKGEGEPRMLSQRPLKTVCEIPVTGNIKSKPISSYKKYIMSMWLSNFFIYKGPSLFQNLHKKEF